jgi:hypothetical protein
MMPASYASTYAVGGFSPIDLSFIVSLVNIGWSIRNLDGYIGNQRNLVNGQLLKYHYEFEKDQVMKIDIKDFYYCEFSDN